MALRRAPTNAQSVPAIAAPATIVLQGDPESGGTDVVLRVPGRSESTRVLGHVSHAPGSARRGVSIAWHGALATLVVVAEDESRNGSTYNSALFRVSGGTVTRLVGGLTDASAPLVTNSGLVLVQRGHDGPAFEPSENGPRALHERTDALSIDAVDLDTGATRTVWSGEGQIAYLATPMSGDEACVFHVSNAGGELIALDAAHGTTRTLLATMSPLARDFSFDPVRNEVLYARAERYGSDTYEIVAVNSAGDVRTLLRAASDHLQPRRSSDGAIAFSSERDRGLAWIPAGAGAVPTLMSPLGPGSDAVLGESAEGAWLAIRHADEDTEALALVERRSGHAITLSSATVFTEFAGFVPAGVSR